VDVRAKIKKVDIEDNGHNVKQGVMLALLLIFKKGGRKKELTVRRTHISIKNTKLLLAKLGKIKALTLADTGISDRHLSKVDDYLRENDFLVNLSFEDNQIGLDGAHYLSRGLVLNKGLRVLNLNNNSVGSRGATLLCEGINSHPTLESLFLNGNRIENEGAHSLAALLRSGKSKLKELHVAYNNISQTGLCDFFDSLRQHNRRLRYLDVAYNLIEIGVLHSLRAMIEKSLTLRYLSISHLHKFNDHAIESLADSLILNQSLKLIDFKKCTKEFYFAMQ